jgi:hypothetical protein
MILGIWKKLFMHGISSYNLEIYGLEIIDLHPPWSRWLVLTVEEHPDLLGYTVATAK